jgi:hypothetical protein
VASGLPSGSLRSSVNLGDRRGLFRFRGPWRSLWGAGNGIYTACVPNWDAAQAHPAGTGAAERACSDCRRLHSFTVQSLPRHETSEGGTKRLRFCKTISTRRPRPRLLSSSTSLLGSVLTPSAHGTLFAP